MTLVTKVQNVKKGGLLLIERELGAIDGLNLVKDFLGVEFDIYEGTVDKTARTVFERALPKRYSELFSIRTPPKVLAAYFIDTGGVLLTSVEREEGGLDPDIFSGMLSAVGNFVQDSVSQMKGSLSSGSLGAMTYRDDQIGEVTIQMSKGRCGVLAVTYDGDISHELKKELDSLNINIHEDYREELKIWEGDTNANHLREIRKKIKRFFFDSKRFEGTMDMDKLKLARNTIKEKLLKETEKEFSKKKFSLFLNDVQDIDEFSAEILGYLVRNSSVPIICQYETEVLGHGIENETIKSLLNLDNTYRHSLMSDVEIETLVKEKFADVTPMDFNVLRCASVIGEFHVPVLSKALNRSKDEIERSRELMEKAGILAGKRFANSRLKERAYERIPSEYIAEIEVSVAEAMESEGEQHAPTIARLLLRHSNMGGEVKEKAVEYSIKAAEQYLRILNTAKALYFFHRAVDVDDDIDRKMKTQKSILDIERATWISKRGRAQYKKDIETLERLAEQAEDEHMKGVSKLFDFRWYKDLDTFELETAMCKLQELKDFAEKLDDKEILMKAYNVAGIVYRKKWKLDEAVEYYQKALAVAEENEIISEKYKIQNNIALCLVVEKEWDRAEELFYSSLETAKELNKSYMIPTLMGNLIYMYSEKGKFSQDNETRDEIKKKILELKNEAVDLCESTGELKDELSILITSAEFLMTYPDELKHVRELYDSAWKIAQRLGYDTPKAMILINTFELNIKESAMYYKEVDHLLKKGDIEDEFVDIVKQWLDDQKPFVDDIEEKFFM